MFRSFDPEVAWTFPRNPASQIASETRDNDSYAFTGITASTKAYVPNGLNQYDRVAGATLLYDANGNLTSDPGAGTGGTTYVYDVENRLVQATNGGVTATLTYDPLGRLYQLVKGAANTRFLYDGDAMVTEYNSAGTVLNRYAHGSSAAADDPLVWFSGSGLTTKRYLHADHLGSIIAATNGNAAPTINSYDEYGVPGSANAGRFQYTGQMWLSEIGLYYYKARVYSPYLGRFLQTDPVGYEGGINLYAYVMDDPVNAADFSGNCPVILHGCGDSSIEGLEGTRSEGTRIPDSSSRPQAPPQSSTNPTAAAALMLSASWPSNGGPPLNEGPGTAARGLGRFFGILGILLNEVFNPAPAGPAQEGLGGLVKERGRQVTGPFQKTGQQGSIVYRADASGRITNYQLYDAEGYPRIRVDLVGKPHGGVPTPHTVEYPVHRGPNGVSVNEGRARVSDPLEIP